MYIRTSSVTAILTFPEGTDESQTVNPGDNTEMVFELVHPTPVEVNQRFNIREGGKTVGTGLVTRVIQ
jgi:elongation factor Tu